MGYFKEKLIEQMGHDLDNHLRFLYAQARKVEKATQQANWWKSEADNGLKENTQSLDSINKKEIFTHSASA